MKIAEAQQVNFRSVVNEENIDLIVAASGYEGRARTLAQLLGQRQGSDKIVLGFSEREMLSRKKNDKLFQSLGYRSECARGDDGDAMQAVILDFLRNSEGRAVKIIVDYSCMTRLWYAAAVRLFCDCVAGVTKASVFFCYTPAAFTAPKPPVGNAHISPIPGFFRIQLPISPTALVVGLGYEAHRASGLVDYVEAAETYAMLANPSFDRRFAAAVERNNKDLLHRIGSDHVVRYPVADLRATEALLSSLCAGLWKEYRVILAPLGPKPFTLISLLLAAKYPMLDVWRVSSGTAGNAYDRMPSGEPIVLRVVFE